LIQPIDCLRS